MKVSLPNNFVQQFPHLKSQWRSVAKPNQPHYFENIYSEDLCQIENGCKMSMKELDLYSIRQAYSFPFCPKIYKYRIQKNYFEDKQIKFDVKILIEKVPFRLHRGISANQRSMLTKNVLSIVKGYDYLCKRYGKFYLKQSMIGWTHLNLVKVWFNEDFGSNKISQPASSQEQIVNQLIKFLSNYKIKTFPLIKTYKTFQSLIEQISKSQNKYIPENIQLLSFNKRLSDTISEQQWKETKTIEPKTSKARKNTTFSFSSKDILTKKNISSKSGNNLKINSIRINDFQRQLKRNDESVSFHKKQASINNDSQISSLKMIIKRPEKKKSFFCLNKSTSKSKSKDKNSFQFSHKDYDQSTPLQFNSNQNSNIHIALKYRSSVGINSINNQPLNYQKPQNLHYSTSTNPYPKLLNKNDKSNQRSHSFIINIDKQNNANYISSRNKHIKHNNLQQCPKISLFETFQQDCEKILIDENEENHMKSSQQIKNDLDALFNSTNEFDANLLQQELDQVFQL